MASSTAADEIRHEEPKKKSHQQPLILRIIWHAFFILVSISMLLPFFWLITSSLKRPEQIFAFPPQWIPNPIHWDNYQKLFDTIPFSDTP